MTTKEYYLVRVYYFKKLYFVKKFFNYERMLRYTIKLDNTNKRYIVLRIKDNNKLDITKGINS